MTRLGDMLVLGNYPPKLLKALAMIADTIHPAFAAQGSNSADMLDGIDWRNPRHTFRPERAG